MEILLSDPALFLLTSLGLAVTAFSIARDTRAQHESSRAEEIRVEV